MKYVASDFLPTERSTQYYYVCTKLNVYILCNTNKKNLKKCVKKKEKNETNPRVFDWLWFVHAIGFDKKIALSGDRTAQTKK